MADGRKNEDIKVIKNPLLQQNLLLEEISGISFIVPAVSGNPMVDNASKGPEVSRVGVKTEGTDAKSLETQSFTDIPLDISENSEENRSKNPLPPADTQEEYSSSFGLRSFIPSFGPLFAPQPLKNTSPNESEINSSPLESLPLKRVNSPETVVPQLLPPPTIAPPSIPLRKEGTIPTPVPQAFAPQAAGDQTSPLPSKPPSLPPPPASCFPKGNTNPYSLKRSYHYNTASTVSNPQTLSGETPFFVPSPVSSLNSLSGVSPIDYAHESSSSIASTSAVSVINGTVSTDSLCYTPGLESAKPVVYSSPSLSPVVQSLAARTTSNHIAQNNKLDSIYDTLTFPQQTEKDILYIDSTISDISNPPSFPICSTPQSSIISKPPSISPENNSDPNVSTAQEFSHSFANRSNLISGSTSILPPIATPSQTPILPPPVSLLNRSGNTNPYTLKNLNQTKSQTSNQNVSLNQVGRVAVPLFGQTNTNSQSSDNINISSKPHIPSSFGQYFPHQPLNENHQSSSFNTFPESAKFNVSDQNVPPVQSFPPAISGFTFPTNELSDSNTQNTAQRALEKDISSEPPPLSSFYSVSFGANQEYHKTLTNITTASSSLNNIQTQVDLNTNKEIDALPSIPLFNTFNLPNNNLVGVDNNNFPINTENIANNTVCVSSITTALSSVVLPSVASNPETHVTPSPNVSLNSMTNVDQVNSENQTTSTAVKPEEQPSPEINVLQSQQTALNSFFNTNITDNQVDSPSAADSVNFSSSSRNLTKSLETLDDNKSHSSSNFNGSPVVICSQSVPLNKPFPTGDSVGSEPANNKLNPSGSVTFIQPVIPTFDYFSSSQGTCLPPALDQPLSFQAKQVPELPTSSFFKPIEGPNFSTGFAHIPPLNNTTVISNPIPTAPPKLSFPPPITFPPPVTFPTKVSVDTNAPPKTEKKGVNSTDNIDLEELDQIPLEGSAVPLYKPDYLSYKKKEPPAETTNSYRLGGGLKKPTYAPVPDLGVTEKKSYPEPNSPTNNSVSSQEEMAAIEAQSNSSRMSPPQRKSSPSNSTTLDAYYTNLVPAPKYRPPYHHWFFKCGRSKKSPWTPFSMADSLNLEQVYTSSELSEDTKVATDGGRYDVGILKRRKISVYWDEPPGEVRRCSWFVKSVSESRSIPYDENIAALLEDEYKTGCETNEWNRRIELADGEVIILHSPSAMAHHVRSSTPDAWGSQPTLQQKPRVVKRGVEDFNISKGEPKQVDHLLLMVHGVGKACDLRFRSLVDVVDDFRNIAQQLVGSHFHSGVENGNVGRVEILPVEWHGALHTEAINDRLSSITLPSIPRAREFTNETLLDILFYTSPVFAETIVQAVGDELNRVFTLYKNRNPGFRGKVSLGGHSLGSLILFDILCHQKAVRPQRTSQASLKTDEDDESVDELGCLQKTKARLNRRMSYLTIGPGTGQPYTNYPQLLFQPRSFFALGSPIGMFVTVRGLESLGEDFKFPTCSSFFNIFHPNDPVAYRIEPLIKPELSTVPAVLIPHHKGRKRMHLELKETMAHVTAALKQKLVDSMKNTWNAVYHLTMFNRKDNALQGEVHKVIEDEVLRDLENDSPLSMSGEEGAGSDVRVGKLNGGRRVDYVLQEAPLETFNQYISAVRSHLVYWESEDTTLMVLKEIYGGMGISPDTQVPQPLLPFDLSGEAETYSEYSYAIGATPTQFVRK